MGLLLQFSKKIEFSVWTFGFPILPKGSFIFIFIAMFISIFYVYTQYFTLFLLFCLAYRTKLLYLNINKCFNPSS